MRGAIVFSVVWAIAYLVCVEKNYALFTYHPAIGEWGVGVEKGRDGPAMYWYGWMASSAIAASLAGGLAMLMPESAARRLPAWTSWMAAVAVMAAFCWLLRGFFK